MNGLIFIWLIVGLLFLIAELGNPGFFFFFSFSVGAFITAVSTLFISSVVIQLFIFLGGTVLSFLLLQRWVKARTVEHHKKHESNMDALKGKYAVVVKRIGPNEPGYINLNGEQWMARSAVNDTIPEDAWVEIVDVRGAHLVVVVIKEKSQETYK